MNNIDYFKDAKYGLMIHFGLYSMLGGFYKGKEGPNYAEWIECFYEIPNKEIHELGRAFNPVNFNAEEICKFAVSCGMKYIVITTKHHEGFCLFKSNVSDFNSVDYSMCHRDLIKELSEACKKYNLKLGFYYSQCIDWNEEDGAGYNVDPSGAAGVSWDNSWDFKDKSKKDYSRLFKSKIVPQIKELLTNYGDIFLFWFDMPLDSTLEQSEIIYDLVKKYQPDCLVNSRLGNGKYDYVSLGDNEIPDNMNINSNDLNAIEGIKESPYGLYESAGTLNCSWGYTKSNKPWKTSKEILNNRLKLEQLGINYLINIGLDGLGNIPSKAKEILLDVSEEYKKTLK